MMNITVEEMGSENSKSFHSGKLIGLYYKTFLTQYTHTSNITKNSLNPYFSVTEILNMLERNLKPLRIILRVILLQDCLVQS